MMGDQWLEAVEIKDPPHWRDAHRPDLCACLLYRRRSPAPIGCPTKSRPIKGFVKTGRAGVSLARIGRPIGTVLPRNQPSRRVCRRRCTARLNQACGLCGGGGGDGRAAISRIPGAPADPMSPLVSFRQVSARLGQKVILFDLSFEVEAGETLVLLGRSGSGKTTALKMVNGLLLPSAGEVSIEGIPTNAGIPSGSKRRTGYVIQDAGLFPHFTVAPMSDWSLGAWKVGRHADIGARVESLLTQVGLPPSQFATRYPRELSGGQRQRVGVARALAADPPLLLMDEPFGALDPVTRVELQQQFLHLRDTLGKTALLVTHASRGIAPLPASVYCTRGDWCFWAGALNFSRQTSRKCGRFMPVSRTSGRKPSDVFRFVKRRS